MQSVRGKSSSGFLFRTFGQGKDELCTNSLCTDNIDILFVGVDDLFDNGEAQAGAFPVLSSGRINFIKTVPDFRQVHFGNTAAHIFYRDKNSLMLQRRFNLDHRIFRTEFNGVIDKIIQHLLDLDHICVDEKGLSGK